LTSALATTRAARRGSDFAGLCREIRELGLLNRRRGNYAARVGLTLAAYVSAWVVFVWVGDSWWQLLTAIALGIVFTQVAFMGHDGGHRQVCQSRAANDALGIVAGDLLVGLSYGWWLDKHNRHHSHPNHEGEDPDIGEGVLAFTASQAANRQGAIARFVAGHQAWLFFPLLTLEGVNLHYSSLQALLTGPRRRYRTLELFLFTVHTVAFVGGVIVVAGPGIGVLVLAVQQAVFGLYMGCSFAPNHKGMPIFPAGTDLDFLRRQVLTSRNVRGGVFTDILLGGLNYQVEHHLFPNMPRPSLRKAQKIVRAYCETHGITYTETSLIGSYVATLRHLHAVGAPLRA
jgi:fatty acid desaturase